MRNSGYPRPQQIRESWQSLDGAWNYAFCLAETPEAVEWLGEIIVPYPPESPLSGVADSGFHPVVWYRRTFSVPDAWRDQRLLLHFGAVDYAAEVWVNEVRVARHVGGHTPFSADITAALGPGRQVVTVRAEDDPGRMDRPRGKQDWQLEPHAIWYPRTTGIWQPVWLEPVSAEHIERVRFTPNLGEFAIEADVSLALPQVDLSHDDATITETDDLSLDIVMSLNGATLTSDTSLVQGGRSRRRLYLPDPGIDNARRPFLWSPESPTLIDVRLTLRRGSSVLDEVSSYTALREVAVRDRQFFLNGRPYFLRLALDQGYWDESLLAAPDAEALKRDVELTKAMGFNGVRKHQKVEDPRYLYWADRLGLLVWEEMPSAYSFSVDSIASLTREWLEVLERDYNHPCIVAWVCFNESWGVPDLPSSHEQRHLVQALYHLTKSLDPTRPVIGNDGWEHVVSDLLTLHDYASDPQLLRERYASAEAVRATCGSYLGHGRAIMLDGAVPDDQPVVLSEFGGIRFHSSEAGWGYQQAGSSPDLLERYRALVLAASAGGLAGFCYTQFADTFQEQNGLLYSDRSPKVDLDSLSRATRGRG